MDYQREQDRRDTIHFFGWFLAYLVVGLGFTMPLWAALLGLY